MPRDTNLLEEYASFAELEAACEVFGEQVNTRGHRVTRRAPNDMLAEERARLHPLPAAAHTLTRGDEVVSFRESRSSGHLRLPQVVV